MMKHLTQRASLGPKAALRPLHAFASIESAGAILLLAAWVTAVVCTNSPWGDGYRRLWNAKLSVGFASFAHAMTLEQWITEGLMVGFYLLIGLEINRQLLFGELATLQRALLPIVAAIGGTVAPVLLYLVLNASGLGAAGWAVPMGTDIAFAVGVLVLVGRSVPILLKVFLLAVAIAGGGGKRSCTAPHQ